MTTDPAWHQQREKQFIEHVRRLLSDDRLRLDTTAGRRPAPPLVGSVSEHDRGVELKRLMSELNRPDRELESRMPVGASLDVTLGRRRWLIFHTTVGRLRAVSLSPWRELLAGETPGPLTAAQTQKAAAEASKDGGRAPLTLVLLSTSGFAPEAHELAERRADRTLILVEPNAAGGWNVYGPAETRAVVDLFDPEAEEEKRRRVLDLIERGKMELSGSGLAADRLAAAAKLPEQFVENELRSYARQHAGLSARRLDGRLVLFAHGATSPADQPTGAPMPFIDRLRALFSRGGETEKKIALLAERRAALGQQRDRAYDELAALEKREGDFRSQFAAADNVMTKRRITAQLVQLRKDMERRQQLLAVLNQQINVVGTHLHSLELTRQGQSARLPDSEELAADAARAEEMLAGLQADSELADSLAVAGGAGLSAEEQAVYEELERQAQAAAPNRTEKPAAAPVAPASQSPVRPAEAEPQAG